MSSGGRFYRIRECYRSPGVHAVVVFRFGSWLKQRPLLVRLFLEPLYLLLNHRIRHKWGIDISRSADIGPGLYIGHYGGITISGAAVIGKNLNISQQVVIGLSGEGERQGCPTFGNNVYLGPGAKIFGRIHIGDYVKIGANAVVYKDIPDNAVVVLDPGFNILSYDSNRHTVIE